MSGLTKAALLACADKLEQAALQYERMWRAFAAKHDYTEAVRYQNRASALSSEVARWRLEADAMEQDGGSEPECLWQEDDEGNWWGGCGALWCFNDGGPADNEMRFCCGCGRPLAQQRFIEEAEKSEEGA